jgi:thiol-disulfide isomerase/thioredoxin
MYPILKRVGLSSLMVMSLATIGLSGCMDDKREPSNIDANEGAISWVTPVASSDAVSLIPMLADQPVIVKVHSDLCGDCQKLAPTLKTVQENFPNVSVLTLNLSKKPACEDGLRNHKALVEAFQPLVTPTLIFIAQGGITESVLAGNQPADTLTPHFEAIDPDLLKPNAAPTPVTDPDTLFACDV